MENNMDRHNIALLAEYDGTNFCGWQSQKNGRSIQDALQKALFILTGEIINLYGCSRTDAGVHAAGHVSNFHSATKIPAEKIPIAMNSHLPAEISVKNAVYADDKFHARFDAIGKQYRYSIWNETTRTSLHRIFNYQTSKAVNIDAMREAAQKMTGTRDFAAFMASGSETENTVRTLNTIDIITDGPQINMIFSGDGFLYNMVRILAGTLYYVGIGKITFNEINDIINSKDRRMAGKTLPACGLTLEKVSYPQDVFCIK